MRTAVDSMSAEGGGKVLGKYAVGRAEVES